MRYDYVLLGGGLQSGILALAIRHHKPSASIAVVERSARLGGNHTWSFHSGDVPDGARPWFDPLVQWRWAGYQVLFPQYTRRIAQPYSAFTGNQLDQVVNRTLSCSGRSAILTSAEIISVDEGVVKLADGRTLSASLIIDSRGPERTAVPRRTGYQKFLGLDVRLRAPHRLKDPILMDTRLPQTDGFRFMYVLPFEKDRLLVEDTYFSNHAELNEPVLLARIQSWIASNGWEIATIEREERGVLPMPCEPSAPQEASLPICGGYAGGWFNPVTGYSLPLAVRLAEFVAMHEIHEVQGRAFASFVAERDRQARFLLLLNRLLFEAAPADARRNVFERVYRLPEDCITRLYAMKLLKSDPIRILGGIPPKGVPLLKAMRTFGEWFYASKLPSPTNATYYSR